MATVTVGTASAAPGTVVAGRDPRHHARQAARRCRIPVVDHQRRRSRAAVFWVNGAIHGDEPEGPLACQIALREVDPAQLSGTLVLCPVVNVPAFEAAQRGNPLDTFCYDMNRIYPGRAERLPVRTRRGRPCRGDGAGGGHRDLDPFGRGAQLPRQVDLRGRDARQSVELATAMGPGWGCIMSNFNPKGSPMAYMKELGKVGITVELGGRSATSPEELRPRGPGAGRTRSSTSCATTRCTRARRSTRHPRYKGEQEALLAPASGLFLPGAGRGVPHDDEEGRPHRPHRQHLRRHAGRR